MSSLPPPRPRFGGRAPALIALAVFLAALGAFAVVLMVVKALPSPVTQADDMPHPPSAAALPPWKPDKSARFAKQGDCVQNLGTDQRPDMILVRCTPDALQVLERLEGTVDVTQCEKIDGYRFHYFYDSELGDKFDFVLCMRKRSE